VSTGLQNTTEAIMTPVMATALEAAAEAVKWPNQYNTIDIWSFWGHNGLVPFGLRKPFSTYLGVMAVTYSL